MKEHRIDIIGAGISGLTTAYYLARALQQDSAGNGLRVTIHVWEKDATPGGLAGTFSTAHFTVEKFYHHIFLRDLALQELLAELGLASEVVWQPADTGAYYARTPYRLASPFDVLKFRPLPFLDRLRLGWLAIHARTVKDWRRLDDISAKEYIHKIAGKNVYRVVWEPLFRGKFGPYADSISAAWLWSKLVDRGSSRNRQGHEMLGYLRGGMGRAFTTMLAYLQQTGHQIHLGQAVSHLTGNAQGISTIHTTAGNFPTDTVVGCTQLPELAAILPESVAEYRHALQKVQFLANVCLVLTLKRSLSKFYWTNVTDPEAPFVGIIEQTNWADQHDFDHKHVVYISAYLPSNDQRLQMSADELMAFYLPAIQKLFPTFTRDAIEALALWHAPYAQPIVHVGYRHAIPATISPLPNFFVCTMAQIYPHDRQMSNGVALAKKTADIIAARIKVP